jgi:hypothetical protein
VRVTEKLKELKAELGDQEQDLFEKEVIDKCLEHISNYRKKLSAIKFELSRKKKVTPVESIFGDKWHDEIDLEIEQINRKLEWIIS